MTLAPFVRILGRGPGRSRSLTRDEAFEAMHIMLSGEADPHAIGALLMLMRMKGEVADEIAGFASAAQASIPQSQPVDLDWPSYAAGRTRGLPWFLLSAKLVARSGRRVLLHGWNGADVAVRAGIAELGIPSVQNLDEAARALETEGLAYLPLEHLSPHLFDLLTLRDVLGLRSSINTVARMVNPGRAPACVQGVFHPSYRDLQTNAAAELGVPALSVIKGGGGEFERHPGKAIDVHGLRHTMVWQDSVPALISDNRRLCEGPSGGGMLKGLWEGSFDHPFATEMVLGTAELAFDTLGVANARAVATDMWADRLAQQAA